MHLSIKCNMDLLQITSRVFKRITPNWEYFTKNKYSKYLKLLHMGSSFLQKVLTLPNKGMPWIIGKESYTKWWFPYLLASERSSEQSSDCCCQGMWNSATLWRKLHQWEKSVSEQLHLKLDKQRACNTEPWQRTFV